MRYPVDVERELDKAMDRLTGVRISSDKWDYFRRLVSEINSAFAAGCEGSDGYPIDVGINLAADTERYRFSTAERRVVIRWMEAINRAYKAGLRARQESIEMEPVKILDPRTGRVLRKIQSARELESCLFDLVPRGAPFGLYLPGCKITAVVTPRGR